MNFCSRVNCSCYSKCARLLHELCAAGLASTQGELCLNEYVKLQVNLIYVRPTLIDWLSNSPLLYQHHSKIQGTVTILILQETGRYYLLLICEVHLKSLEQG